MGEKSWRGKEVVNVKFGGRIFREEEPTRAKLGWNVPSVLKAPHEGHSGHVGNHRKAEGRSALTETRS